MNSDNIVSYGIIICTTLRGARDNV